MKRYPQNVELAATRRIVSPVTHTVGGPKAGDPLIAVLAARGEVTRELGVDFQIHGFDSGVGLPAPADYRDMPFSWKTGNYPMDQDALRKRLQKAQLILGPGRETCTDFFARFNPASIGCILWDLDFYSSTTDAFQMLHGEGKFFLPRVSMYFDDCRR